MNPTRVKHSGQTPKLLESPRPTSRQDRLRVTLIAHDIHDQGGMERALAELIRHLRDRVDFVVLSSTLSKDLRPLVEWHQIQTPRRPFPLKFLIFFLFASRALTRIPSDLVQTLGAIVHSQVDLASIQFCHTGFRRLPSIVYPPESLLRRVNTYLSNRLALLAEWWCYQPIRLRAFGAVSPGLAAELNATFESIPVHIIPNGVDGNLFKPRQSTRIDLRKEIGTDISKIVALFVGGNWGHKRLDLAIEGLAKANSLGACMELWIVGKGDEKHFSGLASDRGVTEQIRFFGHRADPQRFYQAADIFLLPSAYETFSLACFEAAACGLPLVIPPIHGASELVKHRPGGIMIERNPESIANALLQLSADSELRRTLGQGARKGALEFSWEKSAIATFNLYKSLLEPAYP